jgi:FemAB-related protein (PEP-CTERM system-associated)
VVPALTSTVHCREFAETDAARWDAFVAQHPLGTPFHLTAWRNTIQTAFRYKSCCLVATGDEQIRGVLPLFLVKNPVIGKALISSPFAVYGGILAASAEARDALYGAAVELGRRLGVEYIELRNSAPEQCAGESNVSRYVAFRKTLAPGEEQLMALLPKKTRNMVRKALKTPFEARYNVRDTRVLHRVLARNMRRLGTPNFPKKYFDALLRNFGEMADIREVWWEGRPVAVSLNFYFHGEMHTYYAAADSRYNALAPNTFMYFDHLRWAGSQGFAAFDFGRSKRGTTVFEFKKHWDPEMRELPYEIVLVRRKTLPNFSPANPAFHAFIKVWQKLPVPVTRALSPFLLPLFP